MEHNIRTALVCAVVLLLLSDVDAGIFSRAKERAAEKAANAAMGPEKSELVVKAFAGVMTVIAVLVSILLATSTSKKADVAAAAAAKAKKEGAEQKSIEDLNKKNAGDPSKQIIPAPVVLDRTQTEKSKNSAKQSKRKSAAGGAAPAPSAFILPKDIPKKFCNVRPSGVVQGSKSAESLSANNFKKSLVMGGKDYMAEFRTKFGDTAADIVETLTKKHTMLNPLLKPEEPYMDVFEETWNPFKPSRDTGPDRGEELVLKLSKELAGKKILFEDPIFPADASSLFADPAAAGRNASAEQTFRKDQDAFLAGVTGIEWKRPNEWGDTTAKVVMWSGGIDPDDVAQGRLGNCYYLAAIAGCATGGNDVLLKDVCIENYGNVGLYGVKFFINGKWATVIVDDRIPCEKVGSGWKPIFASPKVHSGQTKGEKELWPMIFEKAWAKLHLSYEATAGGLTQDACSYLSGGLTSVRDLERGSDNTDIWDECVAMVAAENGDNFAFLSCAVRDDEDPSHLGLITGHAYSILKLVKSQDGQKFVQIRNPWGESEWTGDYCDSSPLWTAPLKKELGYEAEEDGAFFMSWEHFVMWFGSIEICDATGLKKLTEGDLCRVDGFSSHWVAKKTAGGGPSCSSFKYNPTVTITVDKDCHLALTLLQPDVRPMFQPDQEDLQNKMASAYIWPADTPERDVAKVLAAEGAVCECLPWSRQSTGVVPLKKGVQYNVTACTFAPGQEGAFTITMCGHGLALTPKPFATPTPEHAGPMEANWDPYGCCVACHNTMDGSFYLTGKGPTCPGCAKGKPPQAKVWPKPEEAMSNPKAAAVLEDTTPVVAPQEAGCIIL